ncbi:hypothetical protein [Alteromonas sp. ASW11-130]|uniref:hypothetical protein n=1 Tax=Alteromonas sp. ASW11-130 TaxID=3015775 RepID=UPI002241EEFA|nr:hypothetical protein [Alteromonas sp. ASW11-130]MCW8092332.1 hypothetical protein [Alteromonas sp. ASW11-130]
MRHSKEHYVLDMIHNRIVSELSGNWSMTTFDFWQSLVLERTALLSKWELRLNPHPSFGVTPPVADAFAGSLNKFALQGCEAIDLMVNCIAGKIWYAAVSHHHTPPITLYFKESQNQQSLPTSFGNID